MSGLLIEPYFTTKNKVAYIITASTTSTTYAQILNITGNGILIGFAGQTGSESTSHYLKITIDGVVVCDENMMGQSTFYGLNLMFEFNNSLIVEHRKGGGTYTATTRLSYVLS